MEVNRECLLINMKLIRQLFTLGGYDMTPFSNAAIADAILTICPKSVPGWPTDEQLRAVFDHLVIALGTVTDFRGMRGLPEHALPFKNLQDALQLRNHVIRALEEAAIETHSALLRQQLLTFVVAGGGFSGVEVVAELNDFVRAVAKNYRTSLLFKGEDFDKTDIRSAVRAR